ncbi:MAG: hypothetical protein QOH21_1057 [Acidobacteriota bacterium]|jgi:hypothetical protein|nr:hypothetical protein [Acidobacteriota bacterium]
MLKCIAATLVALLTTTALLAQDAPTDLERRVRELELRIQQMQAEKASAELTEMARQIQILTQEIEALKTHQTAPTAQADQEQNGLGAAASKVYRAEPGVTFGGYGEFLYQNFEPAARVDNADALRAILYTGYKFNDRVIFNSEVEYEHANTERNGEVEVEFAYLDYMLRPAFGVRAGLLLMPIGLTNEQHEPTAFLGARRTQVESRIIPSTWSEIGAGVFGDVGPVTYRAYLTTSLNSDAFTATGIRGGRQMGSQAKANDFAVVGRVDWKPVEGTMLGGSIYSGNSGHERNYGAKVQLAEVHADAHYRGFVARAMYTTGTIDDAAAINANNKLTGNGSVGEEFGGWYVEGGYEISAALGLTEASVTPYARYENFDTQRSVPNGFLRNPANEQNILTIGVAFKPIPQTVIKVDWQEVENEAGTGVNQWNVGLGYIF